MSFNFVLLVSGCAVLLAMTMWRPRLFYEFPYFMAAAFIVFILPQAYALVRYGWGGRYLEIVLFYSFLCLACCWIGYQPRPHAALLERLNVSVNSKRFLHGGIALVLIGHFFMYRFNALDPEDLGTMLTGIGTIYLFFAGLVYPGFAICFYCALKERSFVAWFFAFIAAVIPITLALFHGRREPTALFILTLALSLYFIKGWIAPRFVILAAVAGAMFIIPAVGEYRGLAKENPLEAMQSIDLMEEFEQYFEVDATSEYRNATILIAATLVSGQYGLGVHYWNVLIFRFVPAQLVGLGIKTSLMLGRGWDVGEFLEQELGYTLPSGTTVTGVGDSFHNFGFLGCLVFAAIAYFFKNLWTAANHKSAIVAQILYIQVMTTGMRALTHQTVDFLPGLLYSGIFIFLIARYARQGQALPMRIATATAPRVHS